MAQGVSLSLKEMMEGLEREERELRERLRGLEVAKGGNVVALEGDVRDGGGGGGGVKRESQAADEGLSSSGNDASEEQEQQEHDMADLNPESQPAKQQAPPPAQPSPQPVHLPDEILLEILTYITPTRLSQQTLAACARLSHQWYTTTLPLLYNHPQLTNTNFALFVASICPSINTHIRKSPLADLVRVLDLSALVHAQGNKSVVARLLGRTKEKLEEFVAPQASFSLHALPALGKCARLRTLDLRLVSESPPLPDLFKAVARLERLETLRLPRSTGFGVHHKASALAVRWPENVRDLTLSGGIDAHFLHGVASFPSTLTSLTIEHCPLAKGHAVTHLLRTAVRGLEKLERLKVAHMPRLSAHALDDILFILPQISNLSVSVDYITPAVFDEGRPSTHGDPTSNNLPTLHHPSLRTLTLTSSTTSHNPRTDSPKISPLDVLIAVDEGALPSLRQVRVAQSLGWHDTDMCTDTEALTDALQAGARRDWERREWVFAELGAGEWEKAVFERWGGVWVFEG